MLSFEPYLSTPSLSKDAAQNSAYFFRLCFTSFFRLFRAQNESYEAEIISNNQPDAGERGDVFTVGFGGRWIERPSAEAPMVGDERKGVREVICSQEAMPAPPLVVNVFLYQKMRAGIAISCAGRLTIFGHFSTSPTKRAAPRPSIESADPRSSLGGCWID